VTGLRPNLLTAGGLVAVFLTAVVGLLAADAYGGPPSGPIPLPQPRPTLKADKTGSVSGGGSGSALSTPTTASIPSSAATAAPPRAPAPAPRSGGAPQKAAPALALATSSATSPLDIAAVKQALELVRKNQQDQATDVEGTITDPLARKLVEWVILRSEDSNTDFSRFATFIAANPSWPSLLTLRRHAEVALWQQQVDPQTVLAFFRTDPPRTAKGSLALARAYLTRGDSANAHQAIYDAWRNYSFTADLESQARAAFGGLITPADDKARMDARFYAEDDDAAIRAAHHLDGPDVAIAKARAAVINKDSNAKALLDAVPAAAQRDPGYMFSRIQWLRRTDKIPEAAQLMGAVTRDPTKLTDPDQWWIERRLVARKLLDLNDYKLAYEVADGAAPPVNDNYRAEQQFTAGWIALRFLRQPALALPHFARIADGATSPITLARSFYWQGRASEALGQTQDAKAQFEAAARFPTAYYGQLARAHLGLKETAMRSPPEPQAALRELEVARAFEILYAVDGRDLVASMAADLADKATDTGALATLADIAVHHNDARATLLIGKTALSRGFPFEYYAFPTFGVPNYQQIGPQVEPCVVYSIARQESAFNTRAVSSANALGLMQVTPDAGRTIAKKFGVSFDQHRLMDDVVYNAQIGTAELGDVINDNRGSYILAFVSYNAGRRRAKEWIDQYGDPRDPKVDPVDWIERIPFSETRNYVQRIIENMQVYRALINNDSRLMIEADLRRGG
jgi:soluble lytic murein transglycosylase